MKKLTLQQIAEQENLQTVTVGGKEYIIGEMKYFFNIAEKHHLRINILMKDDNKQQDWTLLPYYTLEGLSVEHIIRNYMGDEYMVVNYDSEYKTYAQRFINNAIGNGASPTEVEKAINDTKAIERMFEDEKIGWRTPLDLVMDNACTEHHIVPSNSDSLVSFKGISLAIALSVPTKEETELALSLVKAGQTVPCLNGMLPEDVYALHSNNLRRYNFRVSGEDGEKILGPYIILDDNDSIGYAYRLSEDGIHWFWSDGEHSKQLIMGSEKFEENSNSLDRLLESSTNSRFISWMTPQKHNFSKFGNMIKLPVL